MGNRHGSPRCGGWRPLESARSDLAARCRYVAERDTVAQDGLRPWLSALCDRHLSARAVSKWMDKRWGRSTCCSFLDAAEGRRDPGSTGCASCAVTGWVLAGECGCDSLGGPVVLTVGRGRWVGGCRPFGMCGLVGGVLFAVGSAVVGAVLINGGIGLPGSRMGHLAFLVGRGIRAD